MKSDSSSPEERLRHYQKLAALGKKLLASLRPLVAAADRGDEQLTATEIFERLKKFKRCPKSPAAVAIKLKRAGYEPHEPGKPGRGKPSRGWFLRAREILLHYSKDQNDYARDDKRCLDQQPD
jgi:hypothetical protein